jgi:hypothetical protein
MSAQSVVAGVVAVVAAGVLLVAGPAAAVPAPSLAGGGNCNVSPLTREGTFETEAGTAAYWQMSAASTGGSWNPGSTARVAPGNAGVPDGGAWAVRFPPDVNMRGQLSQHFFMPAGITSMSLRFWVHITTAEQTTASVFDALRVSLITDSRGAVRDIDTFSNLDAIGPTHGAGQASRWLFVHYDLGAFSPGQTVVLTFSSTTDVSLDTEFLVDNVVLTGTC